MNLLNWRKEMSLGIEDIDRQHYMFFEILGRLHEAAAFNSHTSVMKGLAGDLCCYASLLFRGEENFIALTQDPNACSHLMEHAEFQHRVAVLEDSVILADRNLVRELTEELGDWLESHISSFDHSLVLRAKPMHERLTVLRPTHKLELPRLLEAVAS
ncbi:bacteriohemerythrin [Paludibaculum fermentans]|uniref:bacteriohemerythrin n=1 Tax=Paludibaculum fermentans TaxID=1473598 RepID=UPI003EB85BEF